MGHSTVMDELVSQLPSKPSVIVVAVGDGGLLIGILYGLQRAGSFNLSHFKIPQLSVKMIMKFENW
jgi:threonine dehydratase